MNLVRLSTELASLAAIVIGPLPLAAWLVARRQSQAARSCFSQDVLVFITWWCAIEVSLGLVIGLLNLFTLAAVLIGEMLLFLAGLALFLRAPQPRRLGAVKSVPRMASCTKAEVLLAGVIGFVGVVMLRATIIPPILDHDSLAYHLPIMVLWHQTASVVDWDGWGQIGRYPFDWQVLCALIAMPFEDDFLVAFPNVIAWGLMGLCIYRLARQAGAAKVHSLAASSLVLLVPIVRHNVGTMHVDLAMAAFFLAGLSFLVSYYESRVPDDLAGFLVSAGMLVGIKMSGQVYGCVLAGMAILAAVALGRRVGTQGLVSTALTSPVTWCAFGVCLLVGGFWYARNLLLDGNPLGLVSVRVGGFTVFPGTMDPEDIRRTTLAHLFDPFSRSHWKVLAAVVVEHLNVPLVPLALGGLLALKACLNRSDTRGRLAAFAVIGLLVTTGGLYLLTPYSGHNGESQWRITPYLGNEFRYALPFLGLLGVAAAIGATQSRIREDVSVAAVLISGAFVVDRGTVKYLIVAVLAVLAISLLVRHVRRLGGVMTFHGTGVRIAGTCLLLGALLAGGMIARQEHREDSKRA